MLESIFKNVVKSDSTFATSSEQILQRVMCDFLQRTTSATINERILQRVTSDFLQRATSATSNERILQRVTSDFTTSNEQLVNFNEYRATSGKLRLYRQQTVFYENEFYYNKQAQTCTKTFQYSKECWRFRTTC